MNDFEYQYYKKEFDLINNHTWQVKYDEVSGDFTLTNEHGIEITPRGLAILNLKFSETINRKEDLFKNKRKDTFKKNNTIKEYVLIEDNNTDSAREILEAYYDYNDIFTIEHFLVDKEKNLRVYEAVINLSLENFKKMMSIFKGFATNDIELQEIDYEERELNEKEIKNIEEQNNKLLLKNLRGLIPTINKMIHIQNVEPSIKSWYIDNFLKEISYEDILLLQALMYIGQNEQKIEETDRFDNYNDKLKELSPDVLLKVYLNNLPINLNSYERLGIMLDKTPLKAYMLNGLKLLNLSNDSV